MSGNDRKLSDWIQQHTPSRVTENFLKALRRIAANCSDDEDKFVTGCKALGKFEGKEKFLSELFLKLVDGAKAASRPKIEGSSHGSNRFKALLPLNMESDDSSEEDILTDSNVKRNGRTKLADQIKNDNSSSAFKVPFKRIDKIEARRLKEYTPDRDLVKKVHSEDLVAIPKLETFLDENSDEEVDVATSEHGQESSGEAENESEGSEALVEDREWYNHDDDYGNPVADESGMDQGLDFQPYKRTVQKLEAGKEDTLNSRIQLYVLPLNQRKQMIPPFLRKYSAVYGINEAIMVGSILESSQQGIVNPFKNPESPFSINARKGSHMVALRRLNQDQKDKSKETANISGTAMGDALGVKDKKEESIRDQIQDNLEAKKSNSREEIESIRRSLPVFGVKSKLVQVIRENQVTVVIGETGSGKTTQLAQYLYEAGLCSDGKVIGCTQPRRVAAMSVAKRVALEMNVKLGSEVGYSIRFEDKTSNDTKIKFMTDGILLREALLDETLDKYSCIILDEAHERSLNTEVMLGLLKRLLSKRRDLKVIVTSATMNATQFSTFFGSAPQFTIPGRTFPVQLIYSKFPVEDYVESSVMQAVRIHVSTEINSGDILIFMTGQEDVEATSDVIKEKLTEIYAKSKGITSFEEISDVEIFTVYSALPGDVQNRIFEQLESGKRKIVIATNIAETSLTIDGIRYVVDCGYSKLKVYNPRIGLDSLVVTPISLANANQRSGRAGRTAPGTAYRLYTEETAHEDMYVQAIPEIQRTNLSNTVLLLKSLGVAEVLDFPFLDPPPLQTLMASLSELFFIGALDIMGNLTPLGVEMSKFPLQPSLSKILLIAAKYGCSKEMVTIVSMLSVPQVFYRPKERQKESDAARSRFFVPESDHLTLLNVYSQWKCNQYSRRWCNKHFVHYKSLQRAREVQGQLIKIMSKNHIALISSGTDWDIVRKCICSGFAHQAAKVTGLGKYSHLRTGMDIQLHPTSALYGLGDLPPYVVYHELLMTTKEYICCVTSVDPFWLMEYGGLLYDIKKVGGPSDDEQFNSLEDLQDVKCGQDTSDELDIKLKMCHDIRNKMIESFDAKIPTTKYSDAERKKKRQAGTVQIGFKKRRPFR